MMKNPINQKSQSRVRMLTRMEWDKRSFEIREKRRDNPAPSPSATAHLTFRPVSGLTEDGVDPSDQRLPILRQWQMPTYF